MIFVGLPLVFVGLPPVVHGPQVENHWCIALTSIPTTHFSYRITSLVWRCLSGWAPSYTSKQHMICQLLRCPVRKIKGKCHLPLDRQLESVLLCIATSDIVAPSGTWQCARVFSFFHPLTICVLASSSRRITRPHGLDNHSNKKQFQHLLVSKQYQLQNFVSVSVYSFDSIQTDENSNGTN